MTGDGTDGISRKLRESVKVNKTGKRRRVPFGDSFCVWAKWHGSFAQEYLRNGDENEGAHGKMDKKNRTKVLDNYLRR